ncbi:S-layer homology domain-containing protein [Paenibacillus thalictri]|uniref:SLH domain-containing protein n=1 Tax=Paenibacillus thalictri TaxID=2527873 RepID=A0A4Q9DX90_9BACL|nr:S-layer homology domain-containing protein [Paenibacillus thalictri]TBL80985.1 hypothetical protein EYB31_02470 [Paenibacillus thalictri]
MFRTAAKLACFTLGLTIVLSLYFAGVVEAKGETKTFQDVPPDHWAFYAVQEMVNNGVVDGYQDGGFFPDQELTREQFCKLLTLALDLNLSKANESSYSDVAVDDWSMPYIEAVKDYVSGYEIGIGKPFFDPSAVITREDVAIALVKGAKLNPGSVSNAVSVIQQKFYDASAVSTGIEAYVAIAIQNNLLSGYEDGTFRPQSGLTRAAAVTMLTRMLENKLILPLKDITLSVDIPLKVETPYISISGKTEKDIKLYVNNDWTPNYNGTYEWSGNLNKGEGDYWFEVKAVKSNGRYKAFNYAVDFSIPAPKLTVMVPGETDLETVRISGSVNDINDDSPIVSVNGKVITIREKGEWSIDLSLHEGTNMVTFSSSNKFNKETEQQKSIVFNISPPDLKLEDVPDIVNFKEFTIRGTATDKNDSKPKVTLNNKELTNNDGFQQKIVLTEGVNDLAIRAVNRLGKATDFAKKVSYVIKPPNVTVDGLTETSIKETVSFSVAVDDLYDKQPSIYINGLYRGQSSANSSLTLAEGNNDITIKAVSSSGKETIITKKVVYVILPPKLNVETLPATTGTRTLTVKATAVDTVDSSPSIYLNGSYVAKNSISTTVQLVEGTNKITIRATNSKGKEAVETQTVIYTSPPPVVTVSALPETVTSKSLTIKASAQDANDQYPKLYLNGQYMATKQFETTVQLKDGVNVFEIKAVNSVGKTSDIITRSVSYQQPAPTIMINGTWPASVSSPTFTLSVNATDPNDSSPSILINGKVEGKSSISKTVTLTQGVNTFEFKAQNAAGKVSDPIIKTITYTVPITNVPTASETSQK